MAYLTGAVRTTLCVYAVNLTVRGWRADRPCKIRHVKGYTIPYIILYIIYPFTGCGPPL